MKNNIKFVIEDADLIDTRLDKGLSLLMSDISRSKIKSLIDEKLVFINNKNEKASYKLCDGDVIEISEIKEKDTYLEPQDIPLDVLYEDDDLLVINKPIGMVVHPGAGIKNGTMANALLGRYGSDLSSINGSFRPGIVHRLDKDTSGLLVVAKNDYSHNCLSSQLQDRTLIRKYYALVRGFISEDEAKIVAPIGRDKNVRTKMAIDLKNGKESITNFKVLKRYVGYTLLECKLDTGRTHQIRVHLNYIKHPVIGDLVYGTDNKKIYSNGQLLHSFYISFIHPRKKERMSFEIKLPPYYQEVVDELRELN